ncbi:acyl-CoA synthetase [Actinomadura sp. NPDC047616]|uniref:acyl-CoA synthetase n=1 Tax=Actinomadura sp. NPDC047616 TaxID=3155914 RepID=UPI0034049689
MHPAPHTQGDRPLVLTPDDLAAVEAVPLAERDLPSSTYDLLARTAAKVPHAPALHLLTEGGADWRRPLTWSYGDLLRHVHQAANLYVSLGVRPGGVIGLLLPNTGATYAALLGAQAVGIANPINPLLAADHVTGILALTGAEVLVAAGPSLAPGIWEKAVQVAERLPGLRALLSVGAAAGHDAAARHDAVAGHDAAALAVGDFVRMAAGQPGDRLRTPHRPRPDDLAAYFHTGGTTGTPKVAPHTHANEVYMAWAMGCSGGFLDDSVILGGLPLFHVNAVHVTGLAPFMHGRPVVSLGPLGFRDRRLMRDFWRIVEHFRVTTFSGVPTVYGALPPVPDDADISSLRAGVVGAAPLPAGVRTSFESSAKVPMLEGYGLTEGTCATATMPAFAPRPGSVGLRMAYQQVKAVQVDAGGMPVADLAPGETGMLAIKGPNVFPGYLRRGPDGRPVPDPSGKIVDGWLLTGDLGHVDAEGHVYLTGRAKDLIIRGGHNIDPRPIEEVLLAHPAVTSAAVVGRPDPHAGEVPVAYVTLRPAAQVTEGDLHAWAAERAPEPAAAPKTVHVIDALPLTAIGKVFKPRLVEDAVERVVRAEMETAGLTGTVTVTTRDGRPHATIHAEAGDVAPLAGALAGYPFTHSFA